MPPVPPASSLTSSSGSNSLVKLGTRLVVGITLDGPLLHFPERQYIAKYRLRPYLRYFGNVLAKFKCEVALFTTANRLDAETLFRRFRSEFGAPHRFIFDHSGHLDHQEALQEVAVDAQTRPDRILLIDCKTSHSINPKQLLVVERVLPTKRLRASEKARDGARPEHKSVALTAEDFTLVALAEMIKEMATTDCKVQDYLAMEPLVEIVRVPMFGDVQCLPMENCDHIDQLDLDKLQVSEPLLWDYAKGSQSRGAGDAVGDGSAASVAEASWMNAAKETDAHKNLFK